MTAGVTEAAGPPAGSRAARARRRRTGRMLRATGWTLITAGFLVVAFILYELWGTGFVTARYQDELRADLSRDAGVLRPGEEPLRPIPGQAIAIIRIPDIRLDMAVVEGITPDHLKKGPGHYPQTPFPWQGGNTGIAGHRTTYARPFWALDRLDRGDVVYLDTRKGRFVYRVAWARVVLPHQIEVLDPTARPSVTLTTCNPRFSAAQRLVVRAVQVSGPSSGSG